MPSRVDDQRARRYDQARREGHTQKQACSLARVSKGWGGRRDAKRRQRYCPLCGHELARK